MEATKPKTFVVRNAVIDAISKSVTIFIHDQDEDGKDVARQITVDAADFDKAWKRTLVDTLDALVSAAG
jgi:hypothetical protein